VADLSGKETRLHMLTHLDVVDAGTGWTVTEPFAPKVVDGLLYGRGADDDKGPTAAALLAMRGGEGAGHPAQI
jgi:succinyl-diaminopimelate desuccinylase